MTRERWIVSSAFFSRSGVQADKIFQLHAPVMWEPGIAHYRDKLVIAWDCPGFEQCERLPVLDLLMQFGPIFPSSINWMLAFALTRGYDDIIIAGVDMENGTEYGPQRDYLFYMMGIALGRGVKVSVPKINGIYLGSKIYGVEARE